MSKYQLGDFADEIGCDVHGKDDLWSRLTCILQFVLDPLSDEDLIQILERRVAIATPSEWVAFMDTEDAAELLHHDDDKFRKQEVKKT